MNPLFRINQNFQIGINRDLDDLGAPTLSYGSGYDRSQDFIALSAWFENANEKTFKLLANDYGFLPVLYSMAGIDLLAIQLKTNKEKLNVYGMAKYLRYALSSNGRNLNEQAYNFGVSLFSENFDNDKFDNHLDYASLFTSCFFDFVLSFDVGIDYCDMLQEYFNLLDVKYIKHDPDLTNKSGKYDETITDDAHEIDDDVLNDPDLPDDVKNQEKQRAAKRALLNLLNQG